jgi:transcriptional regulator with XRE-family HTH domain
MASLFESGAIGRMIHAGRALAGLTQDELCSIIGIPQGFISSVERGAKTVDREIISKIEEALRGKGITVTHDPTNRLVVAATTYKDPVDDIHL